MDTDSVGEKSNSPSPNPLPEGEGEHLGFAVDFASGSLFPSVFIRVQLWFDSLVAA